MKAARPHLLVLFGPAAVGKMTVGQAIAARTDFRLFHNHRSIDLARDLFDFESAAYVRVTERLREYVFQEAAACGMRLIFTWALRFDVDEDRRPMSTYFAPFQSAGGKVSGVELRASLATRLRRNHGADRRAAKRLDWATDAALTELCETHDYSPPEDLDPIGSVMRLDNETGTADEAADRICRHLGL